MIAGHITVNMIGNASGLSKISYVEKPEGDVEEREGKRKPETGRR